MHLFLHVPSLRRVLNTVYKQARKWNVAVTGITQNAHDLLASVETQTILANAGQLYLFRQHPADIPSIKTTLQLTPDEANHLLFMDQGELLLLAPHYRGFLKTFPHQLQS